MPLGGASIIRLALLSWAFALPSERKGVERYSSGRGRDGSYLPPSAQIRACGTTA